MIFKCDLPFEKSSAQKNKSYFKGTFFVYFDESCEILDVDVKFESVKFDCMSTEAHFKQKGSWWRFKNELLLEWGIKHIKRSKGKNKILDLDLEQLKSLSSKFNVWRNSRKEKLTIKQLDAVISGSNSSGELKNPSATAFHLLDSDYRNFATVLTKLWNKKNFILEEMKFIALKTELKDFFKMFPWIEKLFNFYQTEVTPEKHIQAKAFIKQYDISEYKEFCVDLNKKIIKAKRDFQFNMDKVLEIITGMEISMAKKQNEFLNHQRAHIKPVIHIKRLIKSEWNKMKNNKAEVKKIISEIKDPNNGIWLSPTNHKHFDTGYAYVNDNWEFIFDSQTQFIMNEHYQNPLRLQYIKYHKKNIYGRGIKSSHKMISKTISLSLLIH